MATLGLLIVLFLNQSCDAMEQFGLSSNTFKMWKRWIANQKKKLYLSIWGWYKDGENSTALI